MTRQERHRYKSAVRDFLAGKLTLSGFYSETVIIGHSILANNQEGIEALEQNQRHRKNAIDISSERRQKR